jgi:ATP-dependent helicase/nuclease subunit A
MRAGRALGGRAHRDAPDVQDVIALVDALVSPAHDLSLARALKSPLFGIDDEALASLALMQRARPESSWFSLLKGDAPPSPSPTAPSSPAGNAEEAGDGDADGVMSATAPPPPREPLPEALTRAVPVLLRWQGWLAALPPHDALSAIYEDGDVLARFGAAVSATLRAGVLANLRGLLGAALEIEGARFVTPYAFVRSLRAGGVRAPSSGASDAVRLLTVHGAKGLEADHVLMLDCDAPAPRAQTMGVLIEWKGDQERPSRFVFMASEKAPPACAQTLLQDEQAARLREELNGLYVATTRARQRLVLSSVQPVRATEGSWWARLQAQCEPVSPQDPVGVHGGPGGAGADGAEAGESFVLARAPRVDLGTEAQPEEDDADASDAEASALGQAMHRLLEWTVPGVPLTPLQVRAAAREFALDASAAHRAATLAAHIRTGAGAWAWEAHGLDWQGNEVTLVHAGRVLRIDRLVRRRDGGAWWVLDYKSAARPEGDAALTVQLRRYRAAVRDAHPGEIVHAAFLTGQGELVILE